MTGTLLGVITIIIAFISYGFYLADVFRGRTKPHGLSWLIWGILNTLIWYQQMSHGAGPGAWVTGVAAIANFIIFLTAFKYGERNITKLDWLCGGFAVVAIAAWVVSPNGTASTVLACLVFVLGLIPTFRKSLVNAHEETIVTFVLNSLKFLIALFALQIVTFTTAAYPLVLFLANGLFAAFLMSRAVTARRTPRQNRRKR